MNVAAEGTPVPAGGSRLQPEGGEKGRAKLRGCLQAAVKAI